MKRSAPMKPAKLRRCKACKESFTPLRPLQRACSLACAQKVAQTKREKEERAADREKRLKLKTRSQWMEEAQVAFNAWVRKRDAGKPCICCGEPLGSDDVGGKYDCGHYRSTGSAPHLRFCEANAHAQRKRCNRWGAGRAVDYRRGLIERIGLIAVEALEADQAPRHYTIDELKAIRDMYRRRAREIA